MRAFVTGGTGFIGANLIRLLLQQGYTVRALVRPTSRLDNLQGLEVEVVKGDLGDRHLISFAISRFGCTKSAHELDNRDGK